MKNINAVALFMAVLAGFPVKAALLIQEDFEDTGFISRGWYDSPRAALSTNQHIPGSRSCFECLFKTGEKGCSGGTPGRHLFTDAEAVYLSFWIKYSDNYVGSGKPYHPHLFHFITNKDDKWVGPSYTHLTTYTEQVGGTVRIALQDGRNNDTSCIVLNDNSFIGCNGNFSTYAFTEDRSVCACNGTVGDLDGRDCFKQSDGTYYSARYWDSDSKMFRDEAGPSYKGDWHFIESCFIMNSIVSGKGVADGVLQYWYDGALILDYHHILFRTGKYPDMKFNQFLIAPYIGDGSPVDQYLWVDNLAVSTTRLPSGTNAGRTLADLTKNNITVRALAGNAIAIVAPGTGPQDFSIRMTDASGRTVLTTQIKGEHGKTIVLLDPALPDGLYFVVMRQPGRQTCTRVVLAR